MGAASAPLERDGTWPMGAGDASHAEPVAVQAEPLSISGPTVKLLGSTDLPTADFRPPWVPADELSNQFGRYQIQRELGRGGMGSVYLAYDHELDRLVALKVPRFAPDDGGVGIERFRREARAAATLNHPNICPIYDVGEASGVHYLTMAYIEGRPLSDLLHEGVPLPERPAAELVRKLALALDEAHRHGVVHRDLKPSNILINQREEPVITDFGLARRDRPGEEQLTVAGTILGTPAYMSPEQVEGDLARIGPAADVFSLGVVLYELLTGHRPFRGSVASMFSQILRDDPRLPSEVRPGLDVRLEEICLRSLSKSPDDRTSMREMAQALADYLERTQAERPTVDGRPRIGIPASPTPNGAGDPGNGTAGKATPLRNPRPKALSVFAGISMVVILLSIAAAGMWLTGLGAGVGGTLFGLFLILFGTVLALASLPYAIGRRVAAPCRRCGSNGAFVDRTGMCVCKKCGTYSLEE